MGWSGGIRRFFVVAAVVFGVVVLVRPETVYSLVTEVYPADPAKREALDMCFFQDQGFNRLDSGERESCYSRAMLVGITMSASLPQSNPIDLRRAAAAGSMPRNDVRRAEETRAALRLPH